jgi:hypothetical protein
MEPYAMTVNPPCGGEYDVCPMLPARWDKTTFKMTDAADGRWETFIVARDASPGADRTYVAEATFGANPVRAALDALGGWNELRRALEGSRLGQLLPLEDLQDVEWRVYKASRSRDPEGTWEGRLAYAALDIPSTVGNLRSPWPDTVLATMAAGYLAEYALSDAVEAALGSLDAHGLAAAAVRHAIADLDLVGDDFEERAVTGVEDLLPPESPAPSLTQTADLAKACAGGAGAGRRRL